MSLRKKMLATVSCALLVSCIALCAGCAPQSKDDTGNAEGTADGAPATTVEWSMQSDCTTCHSNEADSENDSACAMSTHAKQGLTCTSCHADESTLKTAHADTSKSAPKKLSKTEVSPEVCLSCHDRDSLAQATADSTVLTDSNGTVVNPHELPTTGDHGSIACSDCHKMHSDKSVADTAEKKCVSCHHADVYECNTCHEAH